MNYSALPLLTKVPALSALLVAFISSIWMIVLGFQRHVAWGVGLLVGAALPSLPYVVPGLGDNPAILFALQGVAFLIYVAFLIANWSEARRPFFWSLAAGVLMVMAVFSFPGFKVTVAGGGSGNPAEQLRAFMAANMPPPEKIFRRERPTPEVAPPEPAFRSRLPAPTAPPGEKEPPRPGYFYMTERVSIVTSSGIKALSPGEQVILLKRLPRDRLLIQAGKMDFEVESSKVTDDLNKAREIEKQEFLARGGRL